MKIHACGQNQKPETRRAKTRNQNRDIRNLCRALILLHTRIIVKLPKLIEYGPFVCSSLFWRKNLTPSDFSGAGISDVFKKPSTPHKNGPYFTLRWSLETSYGAKSIYVIPSCHWGGLKPDISKTTKTVMVWSQNPLDLQDVTTLLIHDSYDGRSQNNQPFHTWTKFRPRCA